MQGNLAVCPQSHSIKQLQLKSIAEFTVHAFFVRAPDEIPCSNIQLSQNFHARQVDGGKVEMFPIVPSTLGKRELEGFQCVASRSERGCGIGD
jgi:hypothetical protein